MIEYFSEIEVEGDDLEKRGRTPLCSRDRWLKNTLANIIYRCTNPKDKRFKDYGGRGIKTVLTLEDLQLLYERDRPDLMLKPSIDREDVDGNYERDNCRFLELLDNIKLRKRREYPCVDCGVLAFPKKFEGKRLCPACNRVRRVAAINYPAYVQFVIAEARKRGFEIDAHLMDSSYFGSRTRIIINSNVVKVHYAAVQSITSGQQKYWRFTVSDTDILFHVLVAKRAKAFKCWVLNNGSPAGRALYVPIDKPLQKGAPAKTEWSDYENAWHLLAPSPQSQVA